MGRLFGTDGARGIANTELTCEIAMQIGRTAAMTLARHNVTHPRVLIGMDTRKSGAMLEAALCAGLCSVGADAILIGVVPTPAVAYLTGFYNCDAGIMISASHNPCEHNGIKIFDKFGFKLPDSMEEEMEAIILDGAEIPPTPIAGDLGTVVREEGAVDAYIDHIVKTTNERFDGLKIALDCANGSASVCAEKLFSSLGAECLMLSDKPDGVNINDNCGSTHIESLVEFVKENGCDLGLAFDGDADRCIAVDEQGEIVDGDKMIAITSLEMKQRGILKKDTVVMTVMSNLGFFKFAEKSGIKVEVTKVGDRYVLEEMRKDGYIIGGEQSGHIIFLDYASTGDGELSGVQLISTVIRSGKKLSELAACMETYPQVLVNINTTAEIKARYADEKAVKDIIADVESRLCGNGRVLVRPSGTEALIRVMLEGKDSEEITNYANEIAEVIRNL
jgi:phosphoglucosamine mutase